MTFTISPSKLTSIDQIVFNALVKVAMAQVIATNPVLASPFVNFVFTTMFNWVAGKLFPVLNTVIVFSAIDFNDEQQQAAFDAAVAELNGVLQKPITSQKDIQDASDKFDSALKSVVHFDT